MTAFDAWPPVRIAGTGSCVPARVVTNEELAGLGTSGEWIVAHTGIRERRWADAAQATSDLATAAAREALDDAGLSAWDVDLVIVATSTPDHPQPATAAAVHGALGMRPEAGAVDLDAVCSGFVYALHSGTAMLAASDAWNHVLVIGADCYSRITDPADRSTRIFFGDGAGAVVLAKELGIGEIAAMAAAGLGLGSDVPDVDGGLSEEETPGIRSVHYTTSWAGHEALIVPAGGSREPSSLASVEAGRNFFHMDGPAVKAFAVPALVDAVRGACHDAMVSTSDLALIVPHQSNRRILEAAIDELGLPEARLATTVERYGNTAAASIPLTLDDAARSGRLATGDLVCIAGYGGGLSSAASVIRWDRADR